MITADGWVDWAVRLPGRLNKVNAGINPVKGVFMHSAEGYAPYLLELAVDGPLSWHFSNVFDGTLYQHYPLTARCWHATAANQEYVGIENEGKVPENPTLTEPQVVTAARLIREIGDWAGWTPRRPAGPRDVEHTLWEHNEVVRIGGSMTSCPSGRIPWDRILAKLGGRWGINRETGLAAIAALAGAVEADTKVNPDHLPVLDALSANFPSGPVAFDREQALWAVAAWGWIFGIAVWQKPPELHPFDQGVLATLIRQHR